MTATVIEFPLNRRLGVRIEQYERGWLVVTQDREHGWLCGDWRDAIDEAGAIARGYGVAVQSSAGWFVP
jgi:hypothetical protein